MLRDANIYRLAMTKAAVKNMLRLMEDVGPGGDGAVELEQYAHFILQQSEITVAGRERHNRDNDYNSLSTRNDARNDAHGGAAIKSDAGLNEAPPADTSASRACGFDAVSEAGPKTEVSPRACGVAGVSDEWSKNKVSSARVSGVDGGSDSGQKNDVSPAGVCSAGGVGAPSRSSAIVATASTTAAGGPNPMTEKRTVVPGVNLTTVTPTINHGVDTPEILPQMILRQPGGDGTAGGVHHGIGDSLEEGENVSEGRPHGAALDREGGLSGFLGGVHAPPAVGRKGEGDSNSGDSDGAKNAALGKRGDVEEAKGVGLQGERHHGSDSTQNSSSKLPGATSDTLLAGSVANSPLVAGGGGDPVPEPLAPSCSPELEVRGRILTVASAASLSEVLRLRNLQQLNPRKLIFR